MSPLEDDVPLSNKKPAPPAPAVASQKPLHPLIQRYKKPALITAGLITLIVILFYAFDAYTHEETDDAYVTGHLHNISSRINAVVADVLVKDNQRVNAGDVLAKLDPREYLALAAAAKANMATAQSNLDRQEPLVAIHAIAPEDVDKTRNTRDVDLAQFQLAELQIEYSTIKAPA